MKKLILTLVFVMTTVIVYANSLTVINTTGCTYTIYTDGGWFTIAPSGNAYYASPYDIGNGTPADGDFHVVKVALGSDATHVTEYGPFTNTSANNHACNGGSPFNIMWSAAGPNVVVTIY